MRHSKHYIDGSPQSCSNHPIYGDNSVSIDIVVAPHVGITDEQIEEVGLWRYEKWTTAKKMRLSEIPSLMVMQVMLWTAAWTELTVMLKHMEKGHMRYYYSAEYDLLREKPLTLPSSGPVFQALMRVSQSHQKNTYTVKDIHRKNLTSSVKHLMMQSHRCTK